jgi:DNA end-binding protein Ku
MWNGSLVLQDLSVPVKVFAATEPRAVRFHELHDKDGSPVKHRRVSAKTGRELKADQLVKGFETSSGHYVVLTDAEIQAIEQPKRRAIEIEAFVPGAQVDPVRFDRAYHLGAQDEGRDAFAALLKALGKTGLVGLGRVVLRSKEQLVAVRAGDGVLRMSTLRYADELVKPGSLKVEAPSRAPTKREQEMAAQLVDGFASSFDPGTYPDAYYDRVNAYARAKLAGQEPELPDEPDAEAPDDLLAALRASLDAAPKRKPRRKTAAKPKARKKATA